MYCKYDDVMNKQRAIIYGERRRVLFGEDLRDHVMSMAEELIDESTRFHYRGIQVGRGMGYQGIGRFAAQDLQCL